MANMYTVVIPFYIFKGNGKKERIGGHDYGDYDNIEEAKAIAEKNDMEVWHYSKRVY